jgi:hypothetical protein
MPTRVNVEVFLKSLSFYSERKLRGITNGLIIIVLTACGGGGAGDALTPSPTASILNFSGTVAVGAALKNVVVSATCKDGTTGQSSPTDSEGRYKLSINASLPCTFKVIEPATGFVLRSLTDSDGTVNVSPLTEMVFAFSNGDTANIVDAKTKLSSLMNGIGSPLIGDPIRLSFTADETGLDKNIIDLVRVATLSQTNIDSRYEGLRTIGQSLDNGTCLVKPGTGTTFDTSGKPVIPVSVCPKLAVLARFSEAFSSEDAALASLLLDKILTEADSTAWAAIKQATPGGSNQSTTIAIETAQRISVYGIGSLIEKMDRATLKILLGSDVGRTTAKGIANKMKETALGNLRSPTSINPAEFLGNLAINAALGFVVDNLTEGIVNYSYDANAGQQTLAGLTFGAVAYPLETLFSSAISCAVAAPVCGLTVGVNVVAQTTKWIYKDVATIIEITRVNADIAKSAVTGAVAVEMQREVAAFNDAKALGLIEWASTGMKTDPKSNVNALYLLRKERTDSSIARAESSAICPGLFADSLCEAGLTAEERAWFKATHLERLARLKSRFEAQIDVCVVAKQKEGEIGVSKCLNFLGKNPSAPLDCPANQSLRGGQCVGPQVSEVTQVNSNLAGSPQITFNISGSNLPTDIKFAVTTLLACNNLQTRWVSATSAIATCTPARGISTFNYTISSASTPNLDTKSIAGIAGYGPSQVVTITQVRDDVGSSQGALPQNAITDDTTPTIFGELSASLTAGQSVLIYDGANTVLGRAAPAGIGLNWSFTPSSPLATGTHTFTAVVSSVDGIEGARSAAPRVISIASALPTTPIVNSMTPSTVSVGSITNFSINGTNLPTNTNLDITFPACSALVYGSRSPSQHQFSCTPNTVGVVAAIIRTLPATVPLGTFSIATIDKTNAPQAVFDDTFNGTAIDLAKWTDGPTCCGFSGAATVGGATLTLGATANVSTIGKFTFSGDNPIVIEARMAGPGAARDTAISLVDVMSGAAADSRANSIQFGDTSYANWGFRMNGYGVFNFVEVERPSGVGPAPQNVTALGGSTNAFMEYRLTVSGTQVKMERGPSLTNITQTATRTLGQSIVGKSFYLRLSTGGQYSPATYDWVRVVRPVVAPTGTFTVLAENEAGTTFRAPQAAAQCSFVSTGSWREISFANYGPDGIGFSNASTYLPSASLGSLIARKQASYIPVGSSRNFTVSPNEEIVFLFNDVPGSYGPLGGNSGSVLVSYSCT